MAEVDAGAVAPVVSVVPAVDSAPTLTPTAGDESVAVETAPPEVTPEKMLPQSEVNKLVAKEKAQAAKRAERLAMERFRAERAEQDLAQLRAERAAPTTTPGKPVPKDYETAEAYVEALADWKFEERETARAKDYQAQRQAEGNRQQGQSLLEAVKKDSKEFEDFDEVVFGDAGEGPITQPMAYAIAECKAPAKVAYYLRTHADEANRIAELPSTLQAFEVHQLVAKVTAPPVTTKTQPPIVPGGTKAAALTGYRSEMSDKEYAELRKRQIAQRK